MPCTAQTPPATPSASAPAPQPPGTKLLLLRLSLRMDRNDQQYATMDAIERRWAVDEASALLEQLHHRELDTHQQGALFRIEMRLRTLRDELNHRR